VTASLEVMAIRSKNVILILRESSEDDFLKDAWNALSVLRESYLRHVYAIRSRRKKGFNGKTVSSAGNGDKIPKVSTDQKAVTQGVVVPPQVLQYLLPHQQLR